MVWPTPDKGRLIGSNQLMINRQLVHLKGKIRRFDGSNFGTDNTEDRPMNYEFTLCRRSLGHTLQNARLSEQLGASKAGLAKEKARAHRFIVDLKKRLEK